MEAMFARVVRLVFGRSEGRRRRLLRRLRQWAQAAGAPPGAAPSAVAAPEAKAHVDDATVWLPVLPASALAADGVIEVRVEDVAVAVCRVGESFFAVDNVCPHAGGPLADGDLEGHELLCPLHGWSFDLRTGACSVDPTSPVRVHRARARGGQIEVALQRAVASADVAPSGRVR